MSIKEMLEKIKPFYNLLLVLVISSIFFVLGRLSVSQSQKTPINIAYQNVTQTASALVSASTSPNTVFGQEVTKIPQDGPVIGSKSGKKYYFPWCGTVKRIKPENQVHFKSIIDARNSGFLPGGNCKGLK
ncbi:MAG: hypothetical protein CEO12_95 [Parcubacteria group bacterium Gr01-1014_46]|nr:MAG: hypothetical protein CEO12_95 [Parcubacteria group bacterium Gr01-1014_46]